MAAPNNNRFTGGGGSLSSTSPGGGSSSLISQLIQHSSMKNILALFFLPVALPYLMYKFIIAFRKRYGLKMRRLEGKVVVITGASSGIGESLAKVMYANGCRLILAARRVEELERVKAELVRSKTQYGTVYMPAVVQLDLGDLKSMEAKSLEILEIYGFVDILINNAGMSYRGTILETNIDVDQRVMMVNYFGPLALTKNLAHSMVERQCGRVVFISSVQGKIAIPYSFSLLSDDRSSYTASKHALQALADSLRAELTDLGIKVTVISPGYVKTHLSMNAVTGTGHNYGRMDAATASGHSPDYVAARTLRAILGGETDVVICSLMPRIAIFLRNLCPEVFFWVMANRARKDSVG
ncbi:dehydrogenase/reductase SDR family protein 7-like isoform X1 [Folsomia candida]|uniref:dehydrogenase/reductase SDR family protein 7-like isoform X1 n=1 Tax=Folsomia candida TaxID=158441 RepID=UPI000B9059D8|nr:dehydrogenase/reductase SDR family protein 7-like isoform X1 [Folsomia candida]